MRWRGQLNHNEGINSLQDIVIGPYYLLFKRYVLWNYLFVVDNPDGSGCYGSVSDWKRINL